MFQKREPDYIPKHGAYPIRVKKQYSDIFKKFMAMVLAFALVFGTVPITAAASPMEVTFVSGQSQQSGLPVGDYFVDFAEGNFPFFHEATEGDENLVFWQYVTVASAVVPDSVFAPPVNLPPDLLPELPPAEVPESDDYEDESNEYGEDDYEDESDEYGEDEPDENENGYGYGGYENGYTNGEPQNGYGNGYENGGGVPEYTPSENGNGDAVDGNDNEPLVTDPPAEEPTPENGNGYTNGNDETLPSGNGNDEPTTDYDSGNDNGETPPTDNGYDNGDNSDSNDNGGYVPSGEAYDNAPYVQAPDYADVYSNGDDSYVDTYENDNGITNSVTLVWYLDDAPRTDKGTTLIREDMGNMNMPVRVALAFSEVTAADMGVWTLRAYSFGEWVESEHALFLVVGEFEPSVGIVPIMDWNGGTQAEQTIPAGTTLNVTGTVNVTGRLTIEAGAPVTITGGGTLSANGNFEVIYVQAGASLILNNITIGRGSGLGRGISNFGNVTMNAGATITGHNAFGATNYHIPLTAAMGGGVIVFGANATLTMNGGTISNNNANSGGGVFLQLGTLNLHGGTITGNTSNTGGAGINLNTGSTLNINGNFTNANGINLNSQNNPTMTIAAGATLTNNALLNINQANTVLLNNGTIDSTNGTITNAGTINNTTTGEIDTRDGAITNTGTINNAGTIYADATIPGVTGGGTVVLPDTALAVTVNQNGGTGGTGNLQINPAETVNLTAGTPPTGQIFAGWTSTSPGVTIQNATHPTSASFVMPSNVVTVMANWVADTTTIAQSWDMVQIMLNTPAVTSINITNLTSPTATNPVTLISPASRNPVTIVGGGTTFNNVAFVFGNNANVTINGLNIQSANNHNSAPAPAAQQGRAPLRFLGGNNTLTVVGTNTATSGQTTAVDLFGAGVNVPPNTGLIITGTGILTVQGGTIGAGIGGGGGTLGNSGDITISGSVTVNANAGTGATSMAIGHGGAGATQQGTLTVTGNPTINTNAAIPEENNLVTDPTPDPLEFAAGTAGQSISITTNIANTPTIQWRHIPPSGTAVNVAGNTTTLDISALNLTAGVHEFYAIVTFANIQGFTQETDVATVTVIAGSPRTISFPDNNAGISRTFDYAPFTHALTFDPANSNEGTVTWASSDTNVATVAANGQITIAGVGNTNITATAQVVPGEWLEATATFMLTINPATPTANAPTGLTATFGETLANVTLTNPAGNTPGTWAWASGATSVGDVLATPATFPATFTPTDTTNFTTVNNVQVAVTVNQAPAPNIIWPTAGVINYGQMLSNSTLTTGTVGYGTFVWANPSHTPNAGLDQPFSMIFIPSASTVQNFLPITTTAQDVNISVNRSTNTALPTASTYVISGQINTGVTLTLPTLPLGATYPASGTVGGTAALITSHSVSGNTLTFSTSNQPDNTTATITFTIDNATNYLPFNVVVTITAVDREIIADTFIDINGLTLTHTFNGTAQGIGTPTAASGFPGTGTVNFTINYGATGATPPHLAGTYTVTITAQNDTHIATREVTLVINRVQLNWVANSGIANGRVFDNTTDAIIQTQPTLSGIITGFDAPITPGTITFASGNAGTQVVTATGFSVDVGMNYLAPTAQPTFANAVITALPVTITPDTGQTKVFNTADPTFTFTPSPALLGADTFTGSLGRVAGEDVGTHNFTIGNLTAGGNYTLSLGGAVTFEITQAPLPAITYNVYITRAIASSGNTLNLLDVLPANRGPASPAFGTPSITGANNAYVTGAAINGNNLTFNTTANAPLNTATITVPVSGMTNFQNGNITITVNFINEQVPTVNWPTDLTAAAGQTLANVTLPANTGGTAGTFSWVEVTTTPVGGVGNQIHELRFTPTDTTTYATITQNVIIYVSAALSNNANLQSLTVMPANITGTIAGQNVTATVITGVAGQTIDVVTEHANATWTITGGGVSSPSAGVYTVTLNPGNNTVTLTITAEDGTTREYTVIIERIVLVTGVSITPSDFTLQAGQAQALTATVAPADATNQNVTWASGNTAVATINATGLVTAVAPGTATITVTTVDGNLTDTVQVTVTATQVTNHTITATAGNGGSISPSDIVTVNNGANQTFTITPNNNHAITNVMVNGVNIGAVSSHTFTNVTANHTIHATFHSLGGGNNNDQGNQGGNNNNQDGQGNQGGNNNNQGGQGNQGGNNNNQGNQNNQGGNNQEQPPEQVTTPTTIPGHGGADVVNIPITVDEETGTVTILLNEEATQKLIDDAHATAQEYGTVPTVTIDLDSIPNATAIVFTISTAKALADEGAVLTLVFPNGQMTLSSQNLAALANMDDNGETPITVELQVTPGDETALAAGIFFVVEVNITVGEEATGTTAAPFTVILSLADFDLTGLNTYRIIAMYGNPTIVGGRYDAETGLFTFEAPTTGTYTIAYVETLIRLAMQVGTPIIFDLAGNAPTQVMDVLPVIQNGRTLVPIRFVAEALGAEVDWTPATDYSPMIAILALDGRTLMLPIGQITPELAALGMDVPAQVMDGRTMVPLRFVSEFFGALVMWDGEVGGIEIFRNPEPFNTTPLTETHVGMAMAFREDEDEAEAPAEDNDSNE